MESSETLTFNALVGHVDIDRDAVAVVDEHRTWTYGELDTTVDEVAAAVGQVASDEVVAVVAPRTAAAVVGVLAAARVGAAFLAIDPTLPMTRITELVNHSGARLVLMAADVESEMPSGVRRLFLPDEPSRRSDRHQRRAERSDDRLAYLVYTSGTTGKPKGVAVRHAGLRVIAAEQRRVLGTSPDARVYQMANVSFDAFVFELLMAFEVGATLVLPGEFGVYPGAGLAQRLREQRVTHIVATPTALSALPSADLPDLRVVCSVGERCTSAISERWARGRRLLNLYGPAEATIWSTWTELTGDTPPAAIGRPIRGVGVLVLDEAHQAAVRHGDTGELCIVGPTVALGYHRQPEQTASRFQPMPAGLTSSVITDGPQDLSASGNPPVMYMTGDRVRLDEDGTLRFVGRLDDQVKINGVRLEPAESQHALIALPGVADALVVAVPAADGALTLAAAYTGSAVPSRVSAHLRARLPRWAVPTQVVRLDEMPMTSNGKLDVGAVRARLTSPTTAAGRSAAVGDGPVLTDRLDGAGNLDEVSELIIRETREALQAPELRLEDNFFEAGGHSMLAVRLADRIGAVLGTFLDLDALLTAKTMGEWAGTVRSALAATDGDIPATSQTTTATRADGDRSRATNETPVAVVQTEILVAEQYLLGSAAYVAAWCERVDGPFDPDRFAAALRATAQRHELLRTRYRMTAHGAVPIVDAEAAVPDERIAVTGSDLRQAVSRVEQACARPYDLAEEQPVRLHVVRVDDAGTGDPAHRRHLVTIMIHHVACDAAGIHLVLEEVWRRYHADSPLDPAAPPPYTNFAAWQQTFLSGPVAEEQRTWWRKTLTGYGPLRIRPAETRQAVDAARHRQGRRQPFELGQDVARAVDAVCRRLRVGTFAVLSGAYAAAMQDYTTDVDCVIGTPCTVRREPFLETVGLFVNTVPLPLRLPEKGSLTAWLQDWAAKCSAAFARRDLPLPEISKVWRADGRPSVLFALDYTRMDQARIAGRVHLDPGPVKNELLLTINRGGETWTGELVYDQSVILDDEAANILETFVEALETICELCTADELTADVEVLRRARPAPVVTAAEFDFGGET
ncbi:amino acid adenylation domain-containing protein [Actinomadura viridis]|uniref:amino acid adenylation domain-containing protein n=1 Tax=Actinomadura viridis TaxID=58110 RepID=UPI0036D16E4C